MKRKKKDTEKLGDRLEAFLERKEEEDGVTCFMEEMRKNVEAAQHKSFEAEQSLCSALREYVGSYDQDQGRARTQMTKCWQSMQSWEKRKRQDCGSSWKETIHKEVLLGLEEVPTAGSRSIGAS